MRNTRFKTGISGNESTKWKPGQSGNPAGKSKHRAQFEEAFNEALITEGGPEEAAGCSGKQRAPRNPGRSRNFAGGSRRRRKPALVHEVDDDELTTPSSPTNNSSKSTPFRAGRHSAACA